MAKALVWSVLIITIGALAWIYTSDAVFSSARASYEETVSLDTAFEQTVRARYPNVRFVSLLHDNVDLDFESVLTDGNWVPPFDLLSSEEFFGRLEGDEVIHAYFRGHRGYEDEGEGIARYYLVLTDTPLVPAHREFIPYPTGTSKVKSLTAEEAVFEKDTSGWELGRTSLYFIGFYILWAIGIVKILTSWIRANRNNASPSPASS